MCTVVHRGTALRPLRMCIILDVRSSLLLPLFSQGQCGCDAVRRGSCQGVVVPHESVVADDDSKSQKDDGVRKTNGHDLQK